MTSINIKPIETVYNGYRFRSRLEARWAVFFDAAGIRYEYEPQGFETDDGTRYLPDFYLPDFDLWVEVKPERDGISPDIERMAKVLWSGDRVRRIVILSDVPDRPKDGGLPHFPVMYMRDYSVTTGWGFFFDDHADEDRVGFSISSAHYRPPFCIGREYPDGRVPVSAKSDRALQNDVFVVINADTHYGPGEYLRLSKHAAHSLIDVLKDAPGVTVYIDDDDRYDNDWMNPRILAALKAARQARFEHGEAPK